MAAEANFGAMGSAAHLIVVGGTADLVDRAQRRIEDLEQRWSRFLPDSEVSQLNRQAGSLVKVSPETVDLVGKAVEAWRLTGGAFDPTVLGAMVRAGYDRSFDQMSPAPLAGSSLLQLGAVGIRIEGDSVCVADGTGFDPGGIGKGLAADLVCAEIMAAGADGVCINLGGDVRVAGIGPTEPAWTVAVEHPWSERPIAYLGLSNGAVATSTTLRRRWPTEGDGGIRHHLIDPQTGTPSDTDLNLATVVAGDAWMAEVLAKAVLLRGSSNPFDIVGGTGAQALAVDDIGWIDATPGLADFLGGVPLPHSIKDSPGATRLQD